MEDEIKKYVCGFLFFKDKTGTQGKMLPSFMTGKEDVQNILLILKNRPIWQAGKYNGLGGKVEIGEKPFDAMVREFWEESGLTIKNWQHYAVINGPGYTVDFYKAFQDTIGEWTNRTSEAIAEFPVNKLPLNLINSNRYLIPLALEKDMKSATITVE